MAARCYRGIVAWLCLVLALIGAGPALAAPTNITAQLLAESSAAPSETVTLAIRMTPAKGWHGYWSNPGDAGLGMTLDWTLPLGATAGAPSYPVPGTLLISGLMNHVYKGEYAVLVPLRLPPGGRVGERITIAVNAQWLACTDSLCVPEQARLETSVLIGPRGAPDARFDTWRARLPAPLDVKAAFAFGSGTLRMAIPLPRTLPVEDPHLFVGEDKVVAYAAAQTFSRDGDMLLLEIPRPKIAAASPGQVTAVLRLNPAGDGIALTALPGAVPVVGVALPQTRKQQGPGNLALLVLAALAGGLLLNIMPCVFPILSLKALSLARAGESQAQAQAEGLAYTAGVVMACLGLGALMLALRAGGEQVGWAFQLQEPLVVAALLLVAVAVTANLAGLFEFAVPGFAGNGSPRGARGAFATGLLAAFAATPCTGPFMAAAMGAALLLPTLPAMLLFAALGLGLALPFLAIALVPALRRMMPRPGAWMVKFRRWMALPMGLTAMALLWLASRVGGTSFALACATLTVAALVFLWRIGGLQRAGKSGLGLALSLTGLLVVLGTVALPRTIAAPSSGGESILPAQPYTAAALAKARASNKPVFLWYTADWCLTCKVNERVAIERPEVRDAFAKAGVVVLRGDWTRRDPEITRYLASQGAAGVPLYMWYPGGGRPPQQLPQVLTPGSLSGLVKP